MKVGNIQMYGDIYWPEPQNSLCYIINSYLKNES